jgi:hypothetical protein
MEFPLLVLVLPVGLFLLVRRHRRNVDFLAQMDEEHRRGGHRPPHDAALRATGTNSWMRPGGF